MALGRRPLRQRILVVFLIACVVLPVALFFLLRQNALENARRNPWSRVVPGTRFYFDDIARTASGAEVSVRRWSVVLVERRPLEVSIQTRGEDSGLASEISRVSLTEPESRFDDLAPVESITSPWGENSPRARRVETLSPDAHDIYWIDPDLPLYVKHTQTTRDGETTTWLREVAKPRSFPR